MNLGISDNSNEKIKVNRSTSENWDDLYTHAFLPLNKQVPEMKKKIDDLFEINPTLLRRFYPHLDAYLDNCKERSKGLLEVGCGTGIYSYVISKFVDPSYKLYLLDHSEKALELAANLFRGRENTFFIKADIFEKPLSSGPYDAVITGGLIEHFSLEVQADLIAYLKTLSTIQIHQYPVSNGVYWLQRLIISLFNNFRWPFGYEVPLTSSRIEILFPKVYKFYRAGLIDRILFRSLDSYFLSKFYNSLSRKKTRNKPLFYFDETLVVVESPLVRK